MNILPWSKLWGKDYEPRPDRRGDRHKTPLGGLLLELITTIILIAVTAALPDELTSIALLGNLQTIAHCFILSISPSPLYLKAALTRVVMLGFGLFRLRSRQENLQVAVVTSWFPRVSQWSVSAWGWIGQAIFILIYVGMNTFIFVVTALSKDDGVDANYSFNGKYYAAIVLGVVALGLFYYWSVFAAYVPSNLWSFSLLEVGNASCEISKERSFEMENDLTRRFGHRRNIVLTVTQLYPFSQFDQANNSQLKDQEPRWRAALYWLCGGHLGTSPIDVTVGAWNGVNRLRRRKWQAMKGSFNRQPPVVRRDGSLGSQEAVDLTSLRPQESF
jgi:hypothetical protein